MSHAECHCGKDGHPLGSVNCPIHGTWKPIETAPKDGTLILGYDPRKITTYHIATIYWAKDRTYCLDWVIAHHPHESFRPTHWAQIPEPPVAA